MLPAEEFLYGSGAMAPRASGLPRWLRPAAQWLGVGLAHAVVIGIILQISPQARQTLGEVIQASLITPPAPPAIKPEPPKPADPPRLRPPPKVAPVLAAAPRAEAPAAAFLVPEPPAAAAPIPAATPPPPLVPPVFNAAYLENPPPQYPATSRRLGEKGRVLLRVFVSATGRAERVEIKASSGFERLDTTAREAVVGWRFVPARRGDDHVAAWVLVPVSFVM